jgi:hypothetical protein
MDIVTSQNGMKAILELDEAEIKWWRKKMGDVRNRHVLGPRPLIRNYIDSIKDEPDYLSRVKNTSTFIREIRDATWATYVESELLFYKTVVKELLEERAPPHDVLQSVISEQTISDLNALDSHEELLRNVSDIFGNFAGRIFPYFYELSKSVTNSRRSRAGKAFEEIIHSIMDAYNYPYDDQSELGKKTFEQKGLGKMVDGILPGMAAYDTNRSKCLVVTMKTTLRERWQEVVEELNRTNVPSIHLLTLDEGVNTNLLNLMRNHNITLVTYHDIKESFDSVYTNIVSFETFFNTEIPHNIEWWRRSYPDEYPE